MEKVLKHLKKTNKKMFKHINKAGEEFKDVKEGIIDTMYTRGKISENDYRMWFWLNNKTHISTLTTVSKTDTATQFNGIGQGSFAASLASAINIGSIVFNQH